MTYRAPQQQRQPRPPRPPRVVADPDEQFEQWYEAVRPLLRETYLAGYYAPRSPRADTQRSAPTPPVPDRPSFLSNTYDPHQLGKTWEIPDDQMFPGWRKVFHLYGDNPCHKPALIITRLIRTGERISDDPDLLRTVGGNRISPSQPAICGYCGLALYDFTTNANLDWRPHLIPLTGRETVTFADEHKDKPDIFQLRDSLANLDAPLTTEELDGETASLTIEEEESALMTLAESMGLGRPGDET